MDAQDICDLNFLEVDHERRRFEIHCPFPGDIKATRDIEGFIAELDLPNGWISSCILEALFGPAIIYLDLNTLLASCPYFTSLRM